jgi:NTE family protein
MDSTVSRKQAGPGSPKMVNVALQGGGTHGAFTWGVLDRLLEDGRIAIEAISGTSAGAMNAVAVADGVMQDGPDGARQALEDFWQAVSREGAKSPIQRSLANVLAGNWSLDTSPGYLFFDHLTRLLSPYQLNPFNRNPLRRLLEAQIEFDRVKACSMMKLFISATNVHTGRVKVFTGDEITADVVMASACLPLMFQAVEIDGIPYWDGGYMGNPALFPFFDSCASRDVILVQINPIERETTPRTAREILNRMNEISFNSSLLKELRAIEFVARLIDDGRLDPSDYKQVLLHRIHTGEEMLALSASSKFNAEWPFLIHLRDIGREATSRWLDESFERIGNESSTDIRTLFEGSES